MRLDRPIIAPEPQPHLTPFAHKELRATLCEVFHKAAEESYSELDEHRPADYLIHRVYQQLIWHFSPVCEQVGFTKCSPERIREFQGQIRFEAKGLYQHPAYLLFMHGKLRALPRPSFGVRRGAMTGEAIRHHNVELASQRPLANVDLDEEIYSPGEKWKNYFVVWDIINDLKGKIPIKRAVLYLVLTTTPLARGGRVLGYEHFEILDDWELEAHMSVQPNAPISPQPEGYGIRPEVTEKDGAGSW